jgi:hypothetical protein
LDAILNGIACSAPNDCWAVGYTYDRDSTVHSYIEHWDGARWSPADPVMANGGDETLRNNSLLESVTCVSASSCWATGAQYLQSAFVGTGPLQSQPLIVHWDGISWREAIEPNVNNSTAANGYLNATTCSSASDCWAVGVFTDGNITQTLAAHYGVLPLAPTAVVSRKAHGATGSFDVDLPTFGAPGVECRTGGTNNAHQIVFKYSTAVTVTDATVTPASGKTAEKDGPPVRSADGKEITVNIKNVSNAQKVSVTLLGVSDGTNTNDVSVQMSVLAGDTTGDGVVNSGDIAQTKSQSGQFVSSSNFREDVTADGNLNSADIGLTKSKSGTGLP